MKVLILFLCFSYIAVGCKKPINDATMNIHAYNVLDGSGVDSIFVSVIKEPAGDLGNTKGMASGYTDNTGIMTFIYSKTHITRSFRTIVKNFNSNYIVIRKYLNGNEWNGDGQIGGKKKTDLEIQCAPLCNYKLSLINTNCFNTNDTLMLFHENTVESETIFIRHFIIGVGAMDYSGLGCFSKVGTTFSPTNAGNHRFYGYIKRDNGTTNIDTTIFFQPWQDNVIELFF